MLSPDLPPPPADLLSGSALFLDFDGTLVELAEAPDAILVPDQLGALLAGLSRRLDGRLALISGRGIGDLEKYLDLADIAVSGSHGLEIRHAGGEIVSPALPAQMVDAIRAVQEFAQGVEGLIVEDKSLGIALHYRKVPEVGEHVTAFVEEVAGGAGLKVQHGKMMTELRPHGADKGDAVRAFMTEPKFHSARPVFVGDDVTDEDAFEAAARLGGCGILVGASRPTAARYRLDGVDAVARWLKDYARETA